MLNITEKERLGKVHDRNKQKTNLHSGKLGNSSTASKNTSN